MLAIKQREAPNRNMRPGILLLVGDLYTTRRDKGPSAAANDATEYNAPCTRPCSVSSTLFDLIEDIVGNDKALKEENITPTKIVFLLFAITERDINAGDFNDDLQKFGGTYPNRT